MRTLLYITTTCFPDPAVRGIRCTQLARFLPEHGWRIAALTRHYGRAATREQLDRDVHPSFTVEYIDHPPDRQPDPARDPRPRAAPPGWKRAARSFVSRHVVPLVRPPDPSAIFWRRALPQILASARRIQPDAVLLGFPTAGNLMLTPEVKRELGLPTVADFEDPFVIDERFRARGLARIHARRLRAIEEDAVAAADLTTHAIPIHRRWASLTLPAARTRARTLLMACPPEVASGSIDPTPAPEGRRAVRVVGAMDPDAVVTLARAIDALNRRGRAVHLDLVGRPPSSAERVRAILGDRVTVHGFVPHAEALRFIAGADLLINFIGERRSRALLLSSKLFEFIASGTRVLDINPTRSDQLFFSRHPSVRMITRPDPERLADAIAESLDAPPPAPEDTERFRAAHTWPRRAEALAGWLDDICAGDPPGPPAPAGEHA